MRGHRELLLLVPFLTGVLGVGVPAVLGEPRDTLAVAAALTLVVAGALLRRDPVQRRAGLLLYLGGACFVLPLLEDAFGPAWGQAAYTTTWWAVPPLLVVLLSYPGSVVTHRWHRWLVVAGFVDVVLLWALDGLLWDPAVSGQVRPHWLTVGGWEAFRYPWVYQARLVGGIVLSLVACVAFAQRWREVRGLARTAVRSVSLIGIALAVSISVQFASLELEGYDRLSPAAAAATTAFELFTTFTLAAAPLGLLFEALRRRASQVRTLDDLLAAGADPVRVRDVMRRALDDPSMQLVLVLRDRGVTATLRVEEDGPLHTDPLGPVAPGRRRLEVRSRGNDVLAAVDTIDQPEADDGQLHTVLGGAAVVLENHRLQAELQARLVDLRSSRARIVEAGLTERRRVERDLHDGAQQLLLTVASSLGRIEQAREDSGKRDAALRDARHHLSDALAELRRLAHGIHPAVLTQAGLGAALRTLADGAPIPVLVRDDELAGDRLPLAVEATAWFVAAESVTNAIKHSGASSVTVRLRRQPDALALTVSDDGCGGASPSAGGGIAGLRDRVDALGGELSVVSARGSGTVVTAVIPCAS